MFKLIHFWKNTLVLISVTSFKCQNLQNPNQISDKFGKSFINNIYTLLLSLTIVSRYDQHYLIEEISASIFFVFFRFLLRSTDSRTCEKSEYMKCPILMSLNRFHIFAFRKKLCGYVVRFQLYTVFLKKFELNFPSCL